MYSRPLLPFRARPVPETRVRPSPARRPEPEDGDADGEQPPTVRGARRPVKAQPVLTRRSQIQGDPGAQD
ncbi:MAG: hypothetical protein ACM3L9_02740 [Deltaproteobacteria bacterium]